MRMRISRFSSRPVRPNWLTPEPMPTIDTRERIGHSARAMFDLVANVEAYPEFVPLCDALTVLTRRERKGREVIDARMKVGYKAISETFVSRVVLRPAENRIDVSYIDGPFEHLENRWVFHEISETECEIEFHLDYAFRSRALALMMGAVFDRAFARIVGAFRRRADEVYGPAAPVS